MADPATALVVFGGAVAETAAKEAIRAGGPYAIKVGGKMRRWLFGEWAESRALRRVFADSTRWPPRESVHVCSVCDASNVSNMLRVFRAGQVEVSFTFRICVVSPFPVLPRSVSGTWEVINGSNQSVSKEFSKSLEVEGWVTGNRLVTITAESGRVAPLGKRGENTLVQEAVRLRVVGRLLVCGPWKETQQPVPIQFDQTSYVPVFREDR
jgi:hypothetical protein